MPQRFLFPVYERQRRISRFCCKIRTCQHFQQSSQHFYVYRDMSFSQFGEELQRPRKNLRIAVDGSRYEIVQYGKFEKYFGKIEAYKA